MSRPAREIPEGFAGRAMNETILALRIHYRVSPNTVREWIARLGLQRPNFQSVACVFPMPEGFAEFQKGRSVMALCAYYGRNKHVVRRWLAELGIYRSQARVNVGRPKGVISTPSGVPFRRVHPVTAPLDRVQRDMSDAGRAADTLRRDRWTVFRCDELGRARPDGKLWLCGRVLCTDAELIDRAERAARRMAA